MADEFDVVVVGAGAAGLAALERLAAEPLTIMVLEARSRVGGRAFTVHDFSAGRGPTLSLDAGCGWLHSADRNVLVQPLSANGFTLDRTPPAWGVQSGEDAADGADQSAFAQAFAAFENRLAAAAARGEDGPASAYFEPDNPWNGRLNAISSYYNGATWDQVSIMDYAAYEDTGVNWRIREGYGAGVASLARLDRIGLDCPVFRIDHAAHPLRLETARGQVRARAVIATTSTAILAEERLELRPRNEVLMEAAAGLPLGVADKVFLRLARPEALPIEGHVSGRASAVETGSYFLRPFGRPYIEAFFGGALARGLEAEGQGAMTAFALEELARVLGSDIRRALTPVLETAWAKDPWALGSYSHAAPGRSKDRKVLAEPLSERLFFAGEASHPNFFSTAHGAWESGTAAAERAIAVLRGSR